MPASAHRDLLSSALLASHYLLPLRQRLPSPARCWQTTGSRLLRRPSTLPAPLPNHRSLSTRLLRAPSSPRPPPIVPSPSLNAYAAPQVPDELLVERVVGRRLHPETGKIYHLKYSPPENEEIASRHTQRFDDTEEKVKLRSQTHYQNIKSLVSIYEDVIVKVKRKYHGGRCVM
ncbi:uncharacterized protein LOC125513502 isoform X1 [Triticum urartu]|uniref:uncharacterized protein LOC125513502 isoform X1 n=1 Tax=Triticum urartu TaxID=4572 RepID=UPI00204342D2|nr:uncharacterized protein LOC125513502 isoform X1 [Triticum urartu]